MKQQTESLVFKNKLQAYKELIDADIEQYSKYVRKTTLQQYGKNSLLEIDAFLSILERGGKRIRGVLAIVGYEMSGGKDMEMIIQAARALEMMHAYILIIDDIQDKSVFRRGGKAAHAALATYHCDNELAGQSEHFGIALALNSALSGGHAAQMILANLDIDPELRLKVISIMNRTMLVTAHGQTNDIMNEVVADVSVNDINRVIEWKTAHYTFLNPLHVGMVLAGADCHATDAITDYAVNTGKAFQITDDILGIFGNDQETGKSATDDIKEGKRTILIHHALQNASAADKNFLLQMLGNTDITPAEFLRVKDIIVETGSLEYAQKQANDYVKSALQSLDQESSGWSSDGIEFLRGLATYLLTRVK